MTVVQPGQLGGEPATYRGDPTDHADRGVAHRPAAGVAQRRHPRRPVGEAHPPLCDRPAGTLVLVEPGLLSPSTEHRGQSATECDRILDTGVHPLPARWAVDVRRVSGQQDPPSAVTIGQAVVDQEPGAPDDLLDTGRLAHRPPRVQEVLHVGHAGRSGASSRVATIRCRPPGSGATTTSPSGDKNIITSSARSGQLIRTSASMKDCSYLSPVKPIAAPSRTLLCMPSAPTRYRARTVCGCRPSAAIVTETPLASCCKPLTAYGRCTSLPNSRSRPSRIASVTFCGTMSV